MVAVHRAGVMLRVKVWVLQRGMLLSGIGPVPGTTPCVCEHLQNNPLAVLLGVVTAVGCPCAAGVCMALHSLLPPLWEHIMAFTSMFNSTAGIPMCELQDKEQKELKSRKGREPIVCWSWQIHSLQSLCKAMSILYNWKMDGRSRCVCHVTVYWRPLFNEPRHPFWSVVVIPSPASWIFHLGLSTTTTTTIGNSWACASLSSGHCQTFT